MPVFVSYCSQNATAPFIKRFCELLNDAIVRSTGVRAQHVLADVQMREGAQWPVELTARLDEATVLVALYSPLYFASEECGRELGYFVSRLPVEAGAMESVPIVPVWWNRSAGRDADGFPVAPPSQDSRIDALQHRSRDTTLWGGFSFQDISRRGLEYFITNESNVDFRPVVGAFFDDLAGRIDELHRQHAGRLGQGAGEYREAPRLWAEARPSPSRAPGQSPGSRVHFVILAARPEEIGALPQVGGELMPAYMEEGGKDWRPFLPTDGYIGFWLQQIVLRNASGCEANIIVQPDAEEAARLAVEIGKGSQPLFFVIDAWSSRLEPYKRLIRVLSERNLPNCAVVVPFTKAEERPDVIDDLHQMLAQREGYDDALVKTYVATCPKELEEHIAWLYEKMRQKFRDRQARSAKRKAPFGGGPRPTL